MKNWIKSGLIGAVLGVLFLIIAIISEQFKVCDPEIMDGYVCYHFITEYIGLFFMFINPLSWADLIPAYIFGVYPIILTGIIFLFIYGALLGLLHNKSKKIFGIVLGVIIGLVLGVILTALFGGYVKQLPLILAPVIGGLIGWYIYKSKK
jgi:hypothetical protein